MKTKLTLTQLQQVAVEDIMALRENGKAAMGFGLTFLNKSRRGLTAIRRRYLSQATKLGFTTEQAEVQWGDIKDYCSLLAICED